MTVQQGSRGAFVVYKRSLPFTFVYDSFHDQSCQLWSRDGRLRVTGTQIAWYKE